MKDYFVGVCVAITVVAICSFIVTGCDKYMNNLARTVTIVKQRTNDHYKLDNYGIRFPSGNVAGGFTNKAEAEAHLKRLMEMEENDKQTIWETVK